jgi:cupin fold WbuC family metalloprotein
MLIVHHRSAYVRPHRHALNAESLHVIEGRAHVIIFDESGEVAKAFEIGEAGAGGVFYYRMPPMQYHMLIIESEWFVFHETTSGPFVRDNVLFPVWAPAGNEAEPADEYVAGFRRRYASTER